jgi:hypothetical protein
VFFLSSNAGNNFSHNNMVGTKRSGNSPNGIYNSSAPNFTVANNWWGTTVTNALCNASSPAGYCETTNTFPTLATNATSAWPLCCAAPSDPSCVGATTLPSYQACN